MLLEDLKKNYFAQTLNKWLKSPNTILNAIFP